MSTTELDAYELAASRKESALELLAKLGFVDNEDGEFPGTIFHPATGLVIDVAHIAPAEVIANVLQQGRQQGEAQVQAAIRKTLGL